MPAESIQNSDTYIYLKLLIYIYFCGGSTTTCPSVWSSLSSQQQQDVIKILHCHQSTVFIHIRSNSLLPIYFIQ